jgi:hypothetical protein
MQKATDKIFFPTNLRSLVMVPTTTATFSALPASFMFRTSLRKKEKVTTHAEVLFCFYI